MTEIERLERIRRARAELEPLCKEPWVNRILNELTRREAELRVRHDERG